MMILLSISICLLSTITSTATTPTPHFFERTFPCTTTPADTELSIGEIELELPTLPFKQYLILLDFATQRNDPFAQAWLAHYLQQNATAHRCKYMALYDGHHLHTSLEDLRSNILTNVLSIRLDAKDHLFIFRPQFEKYGNEGKDDDDATTRFKESALSDLAENLERAGAARGSSEFDTLLQKMWSDESIQSFSSTTISLTDDILAMVAAGNMIVGSDIEAVLHQQGLTQTLQHLTILYTKYAVELKLLRQEAKLFLKHILAYEGKLRQVADSKFEECSGQYDDLEAEITYMRLREMQPMSTCEVSCRCAWSTFFILSALHQNYLSKSLTSYLPKPILWSYDIIDDSQHLPMPPHLKAYWKFTVGDARQTLMRVGQPNSQPKQFDYLFIDSDHSQRFARDYVTWLLRRQTSARLVGSIHDVYDNRATSKLSNWGPSAEGGVVLEYLATMSNVKAMHTFTVSNARVPILHVQLLRLRRKLNISHRGMLDQLTRFQSGPHDGHGLPSPSLFFDVFREL
jgi:hypothetical protein